MNPALKSLFTFTLLVFRTKQGVGTNKYIWKRVLIFLPQELRTWFDLSSAPNILLAIQHFHTVTALRESHQTSPSALRAETSSRVQYDPPREPKLTHKRQLSLTAGESDFLPLPVFFFGVSSAIADITRVLAIRALCIYISREKLGQAH